ncbi:unnamed protein product [Callosobruchus maculatus]|uniref:Uncharacterized protein n=1 Tax=Callosobruchus maculatus TaxID=64391 RepID=A0A653CJH8_CALMS|nr:unnamed protein product [Callosobruchus maculatus]
MIISHLDGSIHDELIGVVKTHAHGCQKTGRRDESIKGSQRNDASQFAKISYWVCSAKVVSSQWCGGESSRGNRLCIKPEFQQRTSY